MAGLIPGSMGLFLESRSVTGIELGSTELGLELGFIRMGFELSLGP
jgi:hypothetical protein